MRKFKFHSALLFAFILASCQPKGDKQVEGNNSASSESGVIQIDGSSTVYPITEAVAEEFRSDKPNIKVTVGVSGTGGGFKKLIRKEIDIADASRVVTEKELTQLHEEGVEIIELPIAYDGLAVVINPENTWVDYMTVEELKKLWSPEAQGKITKWNQIRASWPDKEIHLYGPGTASGTFDYFTEAIVGEAKASRGDYTASEDDNVLVQGISTDPNALGFFGLEYYLQNQQKLKLVPIDDENPDDGEGPVIPTQETVKTGTYQPLSRPLFIYISKKALDNEAVLQFADFYLENAPELVPDAGYIALTDKEYDIVKKRLQKRVTGSAFAGRETTVGIKMEDLLK